MSSLPAMNRTGILAAPAELAQEMQDPGGLPRTDTPGPGPTDDDIRTVSITEAGPLGSLADEETDDDMMPALDALGGRLAFERGGVRLYDAVLRKAAVLGPISGLAACVPDLERIRAQEAEHALLLAQVIERLGGDPTIETPKADLEGVMSSGLLQVVHDPRTTLLQCLQAAVVAELADLENWTTLVRNLDEQVDAQDAAALAEALANEQEHIATLRGWVAQAEIASGYAPIGGDAEAVSYVRIEDDDE